MKSTSRVPAVLLSFLAAVLVLAIEPGCTTTPKTQASKKTTADKDEWVTLPPALGSNVPRRVRRSQLGSDTTASGVDNVSGEAVMRNVRPEGPPPGAKGN